MEIAFVRAECLKYASGFKIVESCTAYKEAKDILFKLMVRRGSLQPNKSEVDSRSINRAVNIN